MIRKFKIITALLLLVVFVFPIIVKFEHHHHEHFHCDAQNENHFHKLHENCAICSFEFSVFSLNFNTFQIHEEQPIDSYVDFYHSNYSHVNSNYTFLLRAPPV